MVAKIENRLANNQEAKASLKQATLFWLKLGFISFGGPAGQISIMHQELVERRGWISEQGFLHALNYCMLLPGPEAQQLATYIGWLMHKTLGGIIAGVLFVLPSLLLLIALAWVYLNFAHHQLIIGLFFGIKPAVAAIVLYAAYRIAKKTLKTPWLWGIACLAFIAIFFLHLPFPIIIISAALIGALAQKLVNEEQFFGTQLNAHQQSSDVEPAPMPRSKPYKLKQFLLVAISGLFLWSVPIISLTLWLGWYHSYTQMAWFFSKAALLTFGGAYAVLPYVFQGAVNHYQWLSASQMMDGLALGESTPGPLIMIVTFVGFVGGYGLEGGSLSSLCSGIIAALVVTWFTFLPSFIFILAGGPLVEASHGSIRLKAPLTAITAAVVGVILNLALFFSYHVLWPQGLSAGLAWPSLLISIAAFSALTLFNQGIIKVLLACACSGLALSSLV